MYPASDAGGHCCTAQRGVVVKEEESMQHANAPTESGMLLICGPLLFAEAVKLYALQWVLR